MAVLSAIVAVLGVLTTLNLLLCFAIVRRLRESAGDRADPAIAALPRAGRRVQPFTVATITGEPLSDRDLAGRTGLVAFVSPNCRACHGLVDELDPGEQDLPSTIVVFVIGSAADGAPLDFARKFHPAVRVAVVEQGGPVPAAFGAGDMTPTVLRLENGVVQAAGPGLGVVLDRAQVLAGS